jgi:hypothetical protein
LREWHLCSGCWKIPLRPSSGRSERKKARQQAGLPAVEVITSVPADLLDGRFGSPSDSWTRAEPPARLLSQTSGHGRATCHAGPRVPELPPLRLSRPLRQAPPTPETICADAIEPPATPSRTDIPDARKRLRDLFAELEGMSARNAAGSIGAAWTGKVSNARSDGQARAHRQIPQFSPGDIA